MINLCEIQNKWKEIMGSLFTHKIKKKKDCNVPYNMYTILSVHIALSRFCRRKVKLEPYKQYGLIIDGTSVATALQSCPELLKTVGMACEAVVCCRLTPLQKSEVRIIREC